jgi:hypothetical protein
MKSLSTGNFSKLLRMTEKQLYIGKLQWDFMIYKIDYNEENHRQVFISRLNNHHEIQIH